MQTTTNTKKLLQIDGDTKYILICCFGSLRKNFGSNYDRYLKNKSQWLGQIRTKPEYKMLSMGTYPVVVKGTKSIICDVFKISSNRVLQDIFTLEGICENCESNAHKLQKILTEFGEAYIFLDENIDIKHGILVNEGDWFKRPLIRKTLQF